MTPSLTVLMLTFNEAHHIGRALDTVAGLANRVVVVDSGSTDGTREIARARGATVLEHPWVNYATQFNWGLDQLPIDTEWILRLDADELLTPTLAAEIAARLPALPSDVAGVYLPRVMSFLGRQIRWGGIFPAPMLRIFRHGRGRVEERWMDEHVKVDGPTVRLHGILLDDNLNNLTWWIAKHNSYASREVVDLLNLELHFLPFETVADLRSGDEAGAKRWIKENIYARLPLGLRAFLYFFYRYVLRLGFLDGVPGLAFHVLQGFWYRFLVDLKLYEVKRHIRLTGADPATAVQTVLGIAL